MPLYELSVDAALVREAEKVVSLEGREYPTLVMRWDSRLFDQSWQTTLVLDYVIALPPLMVGQATFNEVKIAAFVGGAPTKFLYFGTEMSPRVPRVAPEMENSVAPPKLYQEFRLEEQTCPIPYLKLIQATPRIYGNGAQDYYSPPIKVERYDGVVNPTEHIADFFPMVVANLDAIKGSVLTDPNRGMWTGARYVGVTAIAILRQGKVVGLHRRVGRTDKDPLPPEIKRRDPKLDVVRSWAAIDIGAASTVVAVRGERGQAEVVRVGAVAQPTAAMHYETPSEIGFENLGRTVKAWRDRVILPLTRWEDIVVGQAARDMRNRPGEGRLARVAATICNLPLLRERVEQKESFRLRGRADPETAEALKKPAPPIIDEEGIGAHDPFDPIELFAYYTGLHLNQRARGIYLRYGVTMPTGWSPERRKSVLIAFRRGLFRSLPAGLVEYHDLERLEVVDVGPATIPFSAQAFRAFNIQPKDGPIPFATIDAGASETGFLFGVLRAAKPEERDQGLERMIEHLEPSSLPWLGGERLLHRLAYRVYGANAAAMREARVIFERPSEEPAHADLAELGSSSPDARANVVLLKDAIRPLLEQAAIEGPRPAIKLPASVQLFDESGVTRDVPVAIDQDAIGQAIDGWIRDGVLAFNEALEAALDKIGKEPDRYEGLRVILGGRMGMNPRFAEELARVLPSKVQVHRFKEPDRVNLTAPTVKTSTALGVLTMKYDKIGAALRADTRDAFRYRVGRSRHGQLADALDPSVDYDVWREMGACTKPEVELLYMPAEDDGEIAADDPRVLRALCPLGFGAVGQRLYVRAVGPARVEVAAGPPGGEPDADALRWAVDLKTSHVQQA
uniref:Uncharacterized protein n=1 Tax=Racemicystis crocea TaxID=1707966 RepID=A0A3S7V0K8_9BACT|nr:hypothetical protein [Racemicystis crocea]